MKAYLVTCVTVLDGFIFQENLCIFTTEAKAVDYVRRLVDSLALNPDIFDFKIDGSKVFYKRHGSSSHAVLEYQRTYNVATFTLDGDYCESDFDVPLFAFFNEKTA